MHRARHSHRPSFRSLGTAQIPTTLHLPYTSSENSTVAMFINAAA